MSTTNPKETPPDQQRNGEGDDQSENVVEPGATAGPEATLQTGDDVFTDIDTLTPMQIEAEMNRLAQQESQLEKQKILQQQKNKLLAMRTCTGELKRDVSIEKSKESNIRQGYDSRSGLCVLSNNRTGGAGSHSALAPNPTGRSSLLSQLRSDASIQHQVSSALEALGVETEPEDEESSQGTLTNYGKSAPIKSGLLAKLHDNIRHPVMWPHLKLGVRFCTTRNIDFEQLDLRLLMAGELEIITSHEITDNESCCRLEVLKDLICAAGFYEWSAVKRLHIAILTEIEMCVRRCGDDTSRIEQQVLMPFPLRKAATKPESKSNSNSNASNVSARSGKSKGQRQGLWICSAYQQRQCSHNESHTADVSGKLIVAHHICATCWMKNKVKAQHPDSSIDCPLFEH
jgi:hypothetical protein